MVAGGIMWAAAVVVMVVLRSCKVIGAPVSAGVLGTGGVALSTPKSPAEKLEADFRPGEPGAQRLAASLRRAENAAGAARAQRQPAARPATAENGRARRAWVVIYRCIDVAVTYGESLISVVPAGYLSAHCDVLLREDTEAGLDPGWVQPAGDAVYWGQR
jgi:hypothetical protein